MRLEDLEAYRGARVKVRMTVEAYRLNSDGTMERLSFGSVEEAAAFFGVSGYTVYRLIRNGGMTKTKVAFRAGKPTRKPRKGSNFEKRKETE